MDLILLSQLASLIVILGFLYKVSRDSSRDIADLRERMAKLEGALEGFMKVQR